jgi:hypothetical protein
MCSRMLSPGALHVVGHDVRELTNVANLNRCPQPPCSAPTEEVAASKHEEVQATQVKFRCTS